MARKYGKKNVVSRKITDYSIALMGESGIGKSQTIKDFCDIVVGSDGYIALDIGREEGHNAIPNIISEKVPNWLTFKNIVSDIVTYRDTDYKDIKIIVIDTYDALIEIAEKRAIVEFNRENPDKETDSINGAWGGFGKGQDKALALIDTEISKLKSIGISLIYVAHTKFKESTDPVSGDQYEKLTNDQTQKYFSDLKNRVHILGVAFFDRSIKKVETDKVNIVTKKKEVRKLVDEEKRRISFRDDNYTIDSKSRFADIVAEIPLDAQSLVDAIQDAINKAADKCEAEEVPKKKAPSKSTKTEKKPVVEKEEAVEEEVVSEASIDDLTKKQEIWNDIADLFAEQKDEELIDKIMDVFTKHGVKSASDVENNSLEFYMELAPLFGKK